jgi:ubiquinone/menaquinone biosynthesis C-methylase UbiE
MTGRDPGVGRPIDLGASGVTKRLGAFARHHPLRGERLLDLGCRNGAYTSVLALTYDRVDAVDPTPAHLEQFRASMPADVADRITLHEGAGEDLGFDDATFDTVTCIEVLEHVRSVPATVAEVHRVLRPGGAFLVTVPNRGFPFETHLVTVGSRTFPGRRLPGLPWVPPLHARWSDARIYSARTLRAAVEPAGFRTVAIDYVMPPFDRWEAGRRFVRPVTERLEKSPAKALGVSVVGVFVKQG